MRLIGLLLVTCAVALIADSASIAQATPVGRTREIMHTRVSIAIADPAPAAVLDSAFEAAFVVFDRVELAMNEWREDSPLGQVNAQAARAPVAAPADLCDAIGESLAGARKTDGLFDPTWASVRDLYRFDRVPFRPPTAKTIAARCSAVDWESVTLKPAKDGCTVAFVKPETALGLGGLAKGWGVDRAVAVLRARGFRNFWVQAGGDLYMAGRNGERAWTVGIRDPRGEPEDVLATMPIEDAAFSTSGDYERFAMVDGRRWHHLIDPRTCLPGTRARSVTILARTAVDAEILTKAVFLAGPREGLVLAESFGAGAVIVGSDGRMHVSAGLGRTLQR